LPTRDFHPQATAHAGRPTTASSCIMAPADSVFGVGEKQTGRGRRPYLEGQRPTANGEAPYEGASPSRTSLTISPTSRPTERPETANEPFPVPSWGLAFISRNQQRPSGETRQSIRA